MKKIKKCNLCNGSKFKFLFKGRDKMYGIKTVYSIFQCKTCGLIFVNPLPSKNELRKHYPPKKYYSLEKNSDRMDLQYILQNTYYSKNNSILKFAFLPFKPFLNTIKILPKGRFLDIGCGSGSLLHIISKTGMECYGVELGGFSKNNLNIFSGDIFEANYPSNYFDVIVMNHSLEHVDNPKKTLKEVYRILKQKGALIIGTPVSNSLMFKAFREDWVSLDIPRHLFIFSETILQEYARECGFRIEEMRYNSTPFQFIGSFLYFTNKFRTKPIFLNDFMKRKILVSTLYILFTPLAHIFNLLGIGDQMEIILRK